MPLDASAARLLKMLASAPNDDDALPSVRSRREALRGLAALGADPPDARVTAKDMMQAGAPLRLYQAGEVGQDLIVYLHGGGWVAGDLDTHDSVCRMLAAGSGAAVLAVDYRRPPESPFPAAVEDAADVVDWARKALRPARVVLAGDSAGAHIAVCAVGLLRARGSAPLDLLLLFCPILEIEPRHLSRITFNQGYFIDQRQFDQDVTHYLPDGYGATASPFDADLTSHPPTLLHLAEYDPFRDEGLAYADRLAAHGVPVQTRVHPGMIHNFYTLPRLIPYAREAVAEAARQIRDAGSKALADAQE